MFVKMVEEMGASRVACFIVVPFTGSRSGLEIRDTSIILIRHFVVRHKSS